MWRRTARAGTLSLCEQVSWRSLRSWPKAVAGPSRRMSRTRGRERAWENIGGGGLPRGCRRLLHQGGGAALHALGPLRVPHAAGQPSRPHRSPQARQNRKIHSRSMQHGISRDIGSRPLCAGGPLPVWYEAWNRHHPGDTVAREQNGREQASQRLAGQFSPSIRPSACT